MLKHKTSRNLLILLFIQFQVYTAIGQNKYSVSGKIKSKYSGESLIRASVRILNSSSGTVTNDYGFYSLTLPTGNYRIEFSALGQKSDTTAIELTKNLLINVSLLEESKQLSEVVIKSVNRSAGRSIRGTQTGIERLSIQEIKNIPIIFGEKDILKTIQLLPGIKSAGDGNSGFYVRGGTTDQNQILLDEANVYNASHLFGFFSTFNSDAIKDVTVYKGGIPAWYGGRLSSVVDIKMNDGNNQDFHVSGGIGLISAKINLEGPIQKDKSSFLLSGRRTYADLFLKLSNDSTINKNRLYFYDLNAKLNYELSNKDRLYLSGYFGEDKLGLGDQFSIGWRNTTGTLRWNHIFNSRLFLNSSLIFTNYNYDIKIKSGSDDFDIFSQIRDWNIKQDYQYNADEKNNIRFGWSSIFHTVRPGEITASSTSSLNNQIQQKKYSLENALFITDTWIINPQLNLTYGARLSIFNVVGKGDYYTLNSLGKVIDTVSYGEGQLVKTYVNLEPRLAFGYQLNEMTSIKASYERNVQNMHLISNSTTNTPTDKWISTSNNIKPEISDQVSMGFYKNIWHNAVEFTSEIYYKTMQNIIDYRDGADIFSSNTIESQLLYGAGRAYGIEFLLKKKTGKLTGWVSYTLSKTERKIDGINENSWYNARQDRTHDISIVAIYKVNPKWTLSADWVFYTGDAVTFPNGKYTINGQTVFYYSNRNAYRTPNYSRLDLGATCQLRKTKRWSKELAFSLYNAYGRENPYTITFRNSKGRPNYTEALQTALFKWIPSISYNFKF